jgi:glycosyltransferase involved in cell wall biosynthesis
MKSEKANHPLKLLVVTHFFPAHGGGIEIVAGQLIKQFLSLDKEINIEWFASDCDESPTKQARFLACRMRTNNLIERKIGIPCPLWSPFELGRLWRAVGRCNMVHLHDFAYFGNVCTAIFCRLRRKKYIVTQHIGMVPFQKKWMRFVLEKLNYTLGKWVLGGAAEVVFVSEEVRQYFSTILDGKETRLIPNGVENSIFFPIYGAERQDLKERICTELSLDANVKVALFVGRFVEKKGISLLVELAKSLPDVNWIFAGRGPLEPNGKISNLRVIKGRKGQEIGDLMRVADLFVLPSRGEGFPLVVQEALACGTTVLVEKSLQNALPEVSSFLNVESLGENDDLLRWESKAKTLLDEDLELTRVERAGFAKEMWSWQKCTAHYLKLLNGESMAK